MNLSGKNDSNPASELEQNLNLLRQTYFFSGIPLEALKVIAYLSTREKFKQNEYLFRQGEDDGQAFYIIEGKATLEREVDGEIRIFRNFTGGEFMGGLTLLGKMRRLFSLKATADTICLVVDREKFAKVLEQFQDVMPRIFKAMVMGINNWEERFLVDRTDKCSDCMDQLGVSLL
ncbi:MAG: cyclic nucleotide-binding domain-containing protein [Desulfobacteraceae bacterium]|jgi:CRP-like cAMP-binding protein